MIAAGAESASMDQQMETVSTHDVQLAQFYKWSERGSEGIIHSQRYVILYTMINNIEKIDET